MDTVLILKMMTLQRFGFKCLYIGPIGEKFAKKCISKLRKCSKKELKFILMYDTKKVAFFCSNKDLVPVNLQSHVIYQFECPRSDAKYIGKTDRCLEFRLNEHLDFRTSAVGKHLYECEHFHHTVNLFNISVYSNSENLLSMRLGITSVQEHSNYRQKQQLDSALFLGVSLYQMTESHPQCRHQSH